MQRDTFAPNRTFPSGYEWNYEIPIGGPRVEFSNLWISDVIGSMWTRRKDIKPSFEESR